MHVTPTHIHPLLTLLGFRVLLKGRDCRVAPDFEYATSARQCQHEEASTCCARRKHDKHKRVRVQHDASATSAERVARARGSYTTAWLRALHGGDTTSVPSETDEHVNNVEQTRQARNELHERDEVTRKCGYVLCTAETRQARQAKPKSTRTTRQARKELHKRNGVETTTGRAKRVICHKERSETPNAQS